MHVQEQTHGTRSGYKKRNCPCDPCREWGRAYERAKYARNRDARASYRLEHSEHRKALYRQRRPRTAARDTARQRLMRAENPAYFLEQRRDYERRRYVPSTRIGLPWTPAEDELLLAQSGNASNTELAYMLDRTYNAVTGRLSRLREGQFL